MWGIRFKEINEPSKSKFYRVIDGPFLLGNILHTCDKYWVFEPNTKELYSHERLETITKKLKELDNAERWGR